MLYANLRTLKIMIKFVVQIRRGGNTINSATKKMTNYIKLTKENLNDFVGKTVEIYSKQHSANSDIDGVSTINAVDLNKRNPITCTGVSGEGEFLKYAFVDSFGEICLGDADRYVYVKVQ